MLLEEVAIRLWNSRFAPEYSEDLEVGFRVRDGAATEQRVTLPASRRYEHLAILGKTGSGKSSLLKHFCVQDIHAGRGFVFFDLHGDTVPELLQAIAAYEAELGIDLAGRTVVIDPSDQDLVVGLNL